MSDNDEISKCYSFKCMNTEELAENTVPFNPVHVMCFPGKHFFSYRVLLFFVGDICGFGDVCVFGDKFIFCNFRCDFCICRDFVLLSFMLCK